MREGEGLWLPECSTESLNCFMFMIQHLNPACLVVSLTYQSGILHIAHGTKEQKRYIDTCALLALDGPEWLSQ